MEIGQLRRPITITTPSITSDAFGQPTTTGWTTLLSTWASIHAASSKDVYSLGAGFTSQISHKIVVRYHPSITIPAGAQILYDGRTFIVQAVTDPDEQMVQLHLMCLEINK